MPYHIRNLTIGLVLVLLSSHLFSCASDKTATKAKAPIAVQSATGKKPLQSLISTQRSRVKPFKSLKKKSNGTALPDSLEIVLTQSDLTLKTRKDETGPRFTISAQDMEIKTILFSLSRKIDQNILIGPAVTGLASVDLKEVTLKEALDALLSPLNIKYTIDSDYIRLEAKQMETRIFHLNYIISSRQGSSNLRLSRRSQISGTGISEPSGGTENARTGSNLTSQEVTNLWNEINEGLQSILASSGAPTQNQGAAAAATRGEVTAAGGLAALLDGAADQTQAPAAQPTAEAPIGRSTSSGRFITINPQTGVIVIRDFPDALMKAAEYLEAVEGSSQRQVFIQAKIIEVTLSDQYPLGIDWSILSPITMATSALVTSTAGLTYGLSYASFNLVVNALKKQGQVTVLSSPKIATLNNQRAVIKVGTEDVFFIPQVTPATTTTVAATTFQPATVTVGIILDVVPQINPNGNIMMSITTSISERTGTATSPDGINQMPILNIRESNNVVMAQSGQTIIIGGLIQERERKENGALTLLSKIPLLGQLVEGETGNTNRSELVIMLMPEVIVGNNIDDRFHAKEKT